MRLLRYRELFGHKIPCVVFCRAINPDKAFLRAAEEEDVPVFRSELITMKFINHATLALESMFAPRGQLHGCMVDVQGVGVVIQGESGIGKSEAALGLLERGHSLVADDVTLLRLLDGEEVIGTAKELGHNFMEVRGIGLINVAAMFGIAAIRREKRIDLVITLQRWEDAQEIDRVGLDEQFVELLGQKIPRMTIPVRPGRDLSGLIEVAAFQTKLRLSGYNAAKEFTDRLTAKMALGGGL
jgi:HPr kinase/phosphorylase